jgi:hypothetical protein
MDPNAGFEFTLKDYVSGYILKILSSEMDPAKIRLIR